MEWKQRGKVGRPDRRLDHAIGFCWAAPRPMAIRPVELAIRPGSVKRYRTCAARHRLGQFHDRGLAAPLRRLLNP